MAHKIVELWAARLIGEELDEYLVSIATDLVNDEINQYAVNMAQVSGPLERNETRIGIWVCLPQIYRSSSLASERKGNRVIWDTSLLVTTYVGRLFHPLMISEPRGRDCAHAVPAELMVVSGLVQEVSLKSEADPPVVHPVREKDPRLRGTEGAMQPVLVADMLNPTIENEGNWGFAALHALPV
ncbi:hypothetical protein B0H34DRAFT_680003 [Crassisporium funariophilum]|nr:hypothetical protein B0H34DRAFT_680003 [Crassisporium funariophilum]